MHLHIVRLAVCVRACWFVTGAAVSVLFPVAYVVVGSAAAATAVIVLQMKLKQGTNVAYWTHGKRCASQPHSPLSAHCCLGLELSCPHPLPCRARKRAQPHHRVKRARTHASCTRITEAVNKNNIDCIKWILYYSAFIRCIFTANSLNTNYTVGRLMECLILAHTQMQCNAGQQPRNASLTNLNSVGSDLAISSNCSPVVYRWQGSASHSKSTHRQFKCSRTL